MTSSSLLLGSGELLVPVGAMDDELVLAGLLHQAGLDELRHHVGRELAGLAGLLELHDLLLQSHNFEIFLGLVLLLLQLGFLVGLDLCHGAAPLAGGLQHVRADALGHYKDKA